MTDVERKIVIIAHEDGSFNFEGYNMVLLEEYEDGKHHVFEIKDEFNNRVCFKMFGEGIIHDPIEA